MKKGYIVLKFTDESEKAISELVSSLDENIFFTTTVDHKTMGGRILGDYHLTIFFGIDTIKVSEIDILKEIGNIKVDEVIVFGLDTFEVNNFPCKILYLKVDSGSIDLNMLHNRFIEFPHHKDITTHNFIPHVALGYIKDSVDVSKIKLSIDSLSVKEVVYKTKEF